METGPRKESTIKTQREIIAKLQDLEIRLITNSTDANRPLCRNERDRNAGWVDALLWVLDESEEARKDNICKKEETLE